jgi:ribosome-associated heat shock protein Hsp15
VTDDGRAGVRVDKWLWAARFYKTRALAVTAVEGGKVQINGQRVKRAKLVHPGDHVRIRQGPYEYDLTVLEVAERRGPAVEAAALYRESDESRRRRQELHFQLKHAAPPTFRTKGRPTKRERREIDHWKRGKGEP